MKSRPRTDRNRESKLNRRRDGRDKDRNKIDYSIENHQPSDYHAVNKITPLRALTKAQAVYLNAIRANEITFSIGPAGTGKTYLAGAYASELLKEGLISKIIITRPAVEAGEKFGALPGELEDKYSPFMEAFRDVLDERLGKSYVNYLVKTGKIVASPLSFMRGKTFNDAFVILDESQNVTKSQMSMFLTRIGKNCKMVIDGDIAQKDIYGESGLDDAVKRLDGISGIGIVRFDIDDIVRNGIIKEILKAYAK